MNVHASESSQLGAQCVHVYTMCTMCTRLYFYTYISMRIYDYVPVYMFTGGNHHRGSFILKTGFHLKYFSILENSFICSEVVSNICYSTLSLNIFIHAVINMFIPS